MHDASLADRHTFSPDSLSTCKLQASTLEIATEESLRKICQI